MMLFIIKLLVIKCYPYVFIKLASILNIVTSHSNENKSLGMTCRKFHYTVSEMQIQMLRIVLYMYCFIIFRKRVEKSI